MPKRTRTDWIVIHCSATPPGRDVSAADIDRWHREQGWSGIGYHFVVRLDGTVEPGRPIDDVGSHVKGHNENSVAVCWIGGESRDDRTPAQKIALRAVVRTLQSVYPHATIRGHRDFPGVTKACPSFDVMKDL